ncbi:MAG: hypothetical protein ACSHXK_02000 [Oceanococcus sp.]
MIKLDLNPPGTLAYLSLGGGRGDVTYRDINERAAARLARAEGLCGLRIDAPSMPRPRQLLDVLEHLPALADAAARIRRVAVLSDTPPNEFLDLVRDHFSACEVRHFSVNAQRAADHWLSLADASAAADPVEPQQSDAANSNQDDVVISLDESEVIVDDEIDDWFVKS